MEFRIKEEEKCRFKFFVSKVLFKKKKEREKVPHFFVEQ